MVSREQKPDAVIRPNKETQIHLYTKFDSVALWYLYLPNFYISQAAWFSLFHNAVFDYCR